MMMMDDIAYGRRLPVFVAEASKRLDEVDAAILTLRMRPDDAGARLGLARAAHMIKCAAAALGLQAIVIEAQCIEWWADEAPPTLRHAARTALYEARNELRRLLAAAGPGAAP